MYAISEIDQTGTHRACIPFSIYIDVHEVRVLSAVCNVQYIVLLIHIHTCVEVLPCINTVFPHTELFLSTKPPTCSLPSYTNAISIYSLTQFSTTHYNISIIYQSPPPNSTCHSYFLHSLKSRLPLSTYSLSRTQTPNLFYNQAIYSVGAHSAQSCKFPSLWKPFYFSI